MRRKEEKKREEGRRRRRRRRSDNLEIEFQKDTLDSMRIVVKMEDVEDVVEDVVEDGERTLSLWDFLGWG